MPNMKNKNHHPHKKKKKKYDSINNSRCGIISSLHRNLETIKTKITEKSGKKLEQ